MRRVWAAGLLVVAMAATAACSERDGEDDAAATAAGDEAGTTAADAGEGEPAGGAVASSSDLSSVAAGGAASLPDIGTRVVRTADLRIEVDKGTFGEQLRVVSTIARTLGGFVESSSTSSYEEGEASGEITLRVPVDQYDTAMERLAEIGTIERSSEEGQDVTDQLVDLDARLRALRAEEDALNALIAEAGNVNEVLSIRTTAVGVRQQIEQLAAQQASLDDRASFSTISVLLHESSADVAAAAGDEWTIGDALGTGVDVARTIVGSLIVAVAVAIPLLPFAAGAWWIARRRRAAAAAG